MHKKETKLKAFYYEDDPNPEVGHDTRVLRYGWPFKITMENIISIGGRGITVVGGQRYIHTLGEMADYLNIEMENHRVFHCDTSAVRTVRYSGAILKGECWGVLEQTVRANIVVAPSVVFGPAHRYFKLYVLSIDILESLEDDSSDDELRTLCNSLGKMSLRKDRELDAKPLWIVNGAKVKNVKGSSIDRTGSSWIRKWRIVARKDEGPCSMKNCSANADRGGHVEIQSYKRHYIIPICASCNSTRFDEEWREVKKGTVAMRINKHPQLEKTDSFHPPDQRSARRF